MCDYKIRLSFLSLKLRWDTGLKGFSGGSVVTNPPASTGNVGLIGRSPGEGNGNPLQYSCLENSTDRGAWQATVHELLRVRHSLLNKSNNRPVNLIVVQSLSHVICDSLWLFGLLPTSLLFLHYLSQYAQIHVLWIGDAVSTSHPLLFSFTFGLSLLQHQGLFQWVGSLHQVAKVLEFQLQHQSFQWTFRVDFL